jgi:hypothetical protein
MYRHVTLCELMSYIYDEHHDNYMRRLRLYIYKAKPLILLHKSIYVHPICATVGRGTLCPYTGGWGCGWISAFPLRNL